MSEDFEEVLNDDEVQDTNDVSTGNSSSRKKYSNRDKASSSKDASQNSIKDRLKPKKRIASGRVINEETGTEEKSAGREIVDGASNASALSGGASSLANSSLSEKAKDKLADKIDKKAEKNALNRKVVDDAADAAKVVNGGVDAAKSAKKGDIKGFFEGKKKAKEGSKNLLVKFLKIKLVLVCGAIAAGLLIALFTIYLILGPLMETWQNFDRGARNVADTIEKFTNFYKGFGFQNSKTAFFEEMNRLDSKYDSQLDIPLLLSTIFYSETMGYDTSYQDHVEVAENDPISQLLYGGPDAFIAYMSMWTKDIINEAGNTYDDSTGLVYNAAKIYRLRRLSAAMCERNGYEQSMPVSEFITKYGGDLSDDLVNFILTALVSDIGKAISGFVNPAAGVVSSVGDNVSGLAQSANFNGLEDSANWNTFLSRYNENFLNKYEAAKALVSTISFGLATITSIYIEGGKAYVKYVPYKVNYDKYEEYLKEYYFDSVPEFKKLLPANETSRNVKKEQIISEIKQNTKLFKDIFLQYEDGNIEEYADNCTGAINNSIISELALPVALSKKVMFTTKEVFGIMDGIKHNGVDLTKTNSGINVGDNVYSVAKGKVVGIGHADGTTSGDSSGMYGTFKKYDLSDSELKAIARLCRAEQGTTEGAKAEASLMANRYELYGSGYSSLYNYVRKSGWFANAARIMDSGSYTDSILEGVKDVLVNGNRTLDAYVDEHDCWNCNPSRCSSGIKGDICSLTNPDTTYTSMSQIKNRGNYQSGKTIITNLYGGKYTFSTFPTSSSDPFGYTSQGYSKVQSNYESKSNWVKIEHEIVVNNTEYKFYTIYKYLGEISSDINLNSSVSKGQAIGSVGKISGYNEASVYFEFRNDDDTAIDPTNLFVKCEAVGGTLSGDSIQEQIWNYFVSRGYNKYKTAAILANIQNESGFDPGNVEDCFKAMSDPAFVAGVDNNSISRTKFLNWIGNGCERTYPRKPYTNGVYGFGLSQWTSEGRKGKLYDLVKQRSVSIADVKAQVDYLYTELEGPWNSASHKAVWESASSEADIGNAAYSYCKGFEGGSNCGARRQVAVNFYNKFGKNTQ